MTYEEMLIRHAQQDAYDACAKICEELSMNPPSFNDDYNAGCRESAQAIRQSKEKLLEE